MKKVLCLISLMALSACGDDLADRQAAVEEARAMARSVDEAQKEARSSTDETAQQGAAEEDDAAGDEVPAEVEAPPETFVDSAQGFATEPQDDALGFDPSPQAE